MEEAAVTAPTWTPGNAPVAVVMIALDESHNMAAVLDNLAGWAAQVFLVDSYSSDDTVGLALGRGVHVVQRAFDGFGPQWNFALETLPITAPWTMKLDPDERLSEELKAEIAARIAGADATGFSLVRRLWFMRKRLPVRQRIVRLWRTGQCRFSDVQVNEHPIVRGEVCDLGGELEHHDSPDLHHWLDKQNRYTTAEAIASYRADALSDKPRLFGTRLQRTMWLKRNFTRLPLRYVAIFLHNYFVLGAFRAGWVGYAWARLRADVYRVWEYKLREMRLTGRLPTMRTAAGQPDPRVLQY